MTGVLRVTLTKESLAVEHKKEREYIVVRLAFG